MRNLAVEVELELSVASGSRNGSYITVERVENSVAGSVGTVERNSEDNIVAILVKTEVVSERKGLAAILEVHASFNQISEPIAVSRELLKDVLSPVLSVAVVIELRGNKSVPLLLGVSKAEIGVVVGSGNGKNVACNSKRELEVRSLTSTGHEVLLSHLANELLGGKIEVERISVVHGLGVEILEVVRSLTLVEEILVGKIVTILSIHADIILNVVNDSSNEISVSDGIQHSLLSNAIIVVSSGVGRSNSYISRRSGDLGDSELETRLLVVVLTARSERNSYKSCNEKIEILFHTLKDKFSLFI